jgi:ABC-2 type transport system ATP-binding protein
VAVIDRGAVIAEGTLPQLRQATGERAVVALRGTFRPDAVPEQLARIRSAGSPGGLAFEVIKVSEHELLLSMEDGDRQLPSLLAAAGALGDVREVAVRQPSLENLFIKLTGRELRE